MTTATASTVAAVHVHHLAAATGRPDRRWLTVAAACALPATVLLIGPSFRLGVAGVVLVVAVFAAALVQLYRAAGHGRPVKAGLLLAGITVATFTVELFTFGFLLWGQLLAVPVPILAGVLGHRHLRERG